VVDVALQVDHGRAGGQNAGLDALIEGFPDFALVAVAFAEVHVVANANRLGEEADHVRSFADGLAVRDLALAFVEVLHVEAK